MEYKPLNFANFEFRLLHILDPTVEEDLAQIHEAGADSSLIHCTIQHNNLIDPPGYRALSYCWGDSSPGTTKPIIIDGHTVQVTANLEAALWRLRALRMQTIWIDALCINQKDLVERGLQVMRMEMIFSTATYVVAWLGEDADDACLAIRQLKSHKRYGTPAPWTYYPEACSPKREVRPAFQATVKGSPFNALFRRPFWSRVWIVQEIAKAKELYLLVGHEGIYWPDFEVVFDALDGIPRRVLALQKFRSQEQRGISIPSLFTAMAESRYFESSDIRDKIYAMLGLTSDGSSLVPIPNYVQPPNLIFYQAIQAIISKTDSAFSVLARSAPRIPYPDGHPGADWTNLNRGIPGWLFSILSPNPGKMPIVGVRTGRILRVDSKPGLRGSLCLPASPWAKKAINNQFPDNFPYLTYTGLVASVEVIDSIESITTPLRIPRASNSKNIWDNSEPIGPAVQTRSEKIKEFISRNHPKHPREAKPTGITSVLSSFLHALKNFNCRKCGLGSNDTAWDEIRAAYVITYLCSRGKWAPVHHPITPKDHFLNWIYNNQALMYRGRSLREWVELYENDESYKRQRLAVEGSTTRRSRFSRLVSNKYWERDIQSITDGLHELSESLAHAAQFRLRLAVGKETSLLGYVDPEVREGDIICLIRYSRVPVVLRKDRTGYHFICEGHWQPDILHPTNLVRLGTTRLTINEYKTVVIH